METLPFLPEIKIRGENLTYSDGVLTYTVGDKGPINLGRVPRGRRPLRGVVRDLTVLTITADPAVPKYGTNVAPTACGAKVVVGWVGRLRPGCFGSGIKRTGQG